METGLQDYGFRIYDSKLARFLSIDPLPYAYPMLSSYQFSGNTPLVCIDLDGGEPKFPPLPGQNGQTLHAPKLDGPKAGKLEVWTAWNGQWTSSNLPVHVGAPSPSIYQGPSTYYDVAQVKYGVPDGIHSAQLNSEIPAYMSSYIAQPVFNANNTLSHFIVSWEKTVIDNTGYHSRAVNFGIIRPEDFAEYYENPSKLNTLAFANESSLAVKLKAEGGNYLGAAWQNTKEKLTDPNEWFKAAMIVAGSAVSSTSRRAINKPEDVMKNPKSMEGTSYKVIKEKLKIVPAGGILQ